MSPPISVALLNGKKTRSTQTLKDVCCLFHIRQISACEAYQYNVAVCQKLEVISLVKVGRGSPRSVHTSTRLESQADRHTGRVQRAKWRLLEVCFTKL